MTEFDDVDNNVHGKVPEFGAIFMSNRATKKECFRRKIFGLPSSQAYFVKQVKAGMVLFLFEFENRELYGVFQACSEGAMNIVPHAYKSSGKQFPAQVPFTLIWCCSPLSEREFRVAIKENYYGAYKFNFGLSKVQVHRLLQLFSSRRLRNKPPEKQLTTFNGTKSIGNPLGKAHGRDDFVSHLMSDRIESERVVDNDIGPIILSGGTENSWGKAVLHHHGRFSEHDKVKTKNYKNCDHILALSPECPANSWVETRRAADDAWFARSDRIKNEYNVTNDHGSLDFTVPYTNLWGDVRRAVNDSGFSISDRAGGGCIVDNEHEPFSQTQNLRNSLVLGKRVSETGRFELNHSVGNGHHVDSHLHPVIETEYLEDSLRNIRSVSADDVEFKTNCSGRNDCYVDNDLGPVKPNKYLRDKGKIVADDNHRFITSESITNERSVGNVGNDHRFFLPTDYSCVSQSNINPLYSTTSIQETSNCLVQNHLSSPALVYSSCGMVLGSLVEQERASYCNLPGGNFVPSLKTQPNLVQDYASPYHIPLNSVSCPFKNQPAFSDLEPKVSKCLDPPSSSRNSLSLPGPSHHKYSCFREPIHLPEPGFRGKRTLESSDLESYKSETISESSLHPVSILGSEKYAKEAMGPQFYSSNLSQNYSSSIQQYSLASQEKFEHKTLLCEDCEDFTATVPSYSENKCNSHDSAFSLQSRHINSNVHDSVSHEYGYCENIEGKNSDFPNSRSSVFSRLTPAPKVNLRGYHSVWSDDEYNLDKSVDDMMELLDWDQFYSLKSNDTAVDHYNLDVSVDDIMELLDRNLFCRLKKNNTSKSFAGEHSDVENFKIKKQASSRSQTRRVCTKMSQMENKADVALSTGMNVNQIDEEMPFIDFKRRSEVQKIQNKHGTKGSVNVESEGLTCGQHKRRKLVRPNFSISELSHDKQCCRDLFKSTSNLTKSDVIGCHGCDGGTADNEVGSKCGGEMNAKNCAVLLRSGSKGKEKLSEDISIQKVSSSVPCSLKNHNTEEDSSAKDSKVDELSQNHLSILPCLSNVREPYREPSECSGIVLNSRGSSNVNGEGYFKSTENPDKSCPVSCEIAVGMTEGGGLSNLNEKLERIP